MLSFKEFILQFFCEAGGADFKLINPLIDPQDKKQGRKKNFNPVEVGGDRTPEQAHHQDLLNAWNYIMSKSVPDDVKKAQYEGTTFEGHPNDFMMGTNPAEHVRSIEHLEHLVAPVFNIIKRDKTSKEQQDIMDSYKEHVEKTGRYKALHNGAVVEGNPFKVWQITGGESGQGTSIGPLTNGKDLWCTGGRNLVYSAGQQAKYDNGGRNLVFHFPGVSQRTNPKTNKPFNKNLEYIYSAIGSKQTPIKGNGGNFQHLGNGFVSDEDWEGLSEAYGLGH